jgi:hypothetical protein
MCARCHEEIYLCKVNGLGADICINYLCKKCSDEYCKVRDAPGQGMGLAHLCNTRFCYWIETGEYMPYQIAVDMTEKKFSELNAEERKYYDAAAKTWKRLAGESPAPFVKDCYGQV